MPPELKEIEKPFHVIFEGEIPEGNSGFRSGHLDKEKALVEATRCRAALDKNKLSGSYKVIPKPN